MSALSSAASADSTTDSPELGFDTPSSVNRTLGGEPYSPITSPESRSTRTWRHWGISRAQTLDAPPEEGITPPLRATVSCHAGDVVLISSQADSLARTSPSLADEQGSLESDPASSTSSPASLSLFDPAGFSSRTFQVSSLATAVGTSEQSLERWPTSGTAWPGGFSTAVTSECRSDEGGCSSSEPSLTEILEEPQNVPAKYSLSARAARGLIKRTRKRGRTLPPPLEQALEAVAAGTLTLIGRR